MKLYEAAELNPTLAGLVRANVRLPELVMGDFHAQIAGGAVGGERLLEFMEEFGLARLEPLGDEIVGRTERAMRESIARLRPGAYTYALTSDGFDEPITIQVRCEARGGELTIDYTGSSPESRRGINVVMNYTEAYSTYGAKVIVSPDVPNNEGAFRPVRITAPEGSILNARHPAPVAARHVVGHFLPTRSRERSARRCPERVMAEGSANIWGVQVSGRDEGGRAFSFVLFTSGGTGARATKDGLSATAFPPASSAPRGSDRDALPLVIERQGAATRFRRRRPLPRRARPGHRLPRADPRDLPLLRALRSHAHPCPGLLRRWGRPPRRGARQWPRAREPKGRADARAR